MVYPAAFQAMHERADHVVLANQLLESRRPQAPRQYLITHREIQ
jgi:hypothetical protein